MCIVFVALYFSTKNKNKTQDNLDRTPNIPYQEKSGGDPNKVILYYKQSLKAWKNKNLDQSRELANKAVDEYDNLTLSQQDKLQSYSDLTTKLIDLSEGRYYELKR